MSEDEIITTVQTAIKLLYTKDKALISNDLCERCLVHRLAFHLQSLFPAYYVDCEFNKSFYHNKVGNKILTSIWGNYIDIIVHKRSNVPNENLICIETKKEKNKKDRFKDRENLKILTSNDRFAYKLGFYIILGKTYKETRVELYSNGEFKDEICLPNTNSNHR